MKKEIKKKEIIKTEELSKIIESSPAPLEMVEYLRFVVSLTTYAEKNSPYYDEHTRATTIPAGTEMRTDKCPGWIDKEFEIKRGNIEIIKYPKGKFFKLLITTQRCYTDELGHSRSETILSDTAWAYDDVPNWLDKDTLLKAKQASVVEY